MWTLTGKLMPKWRMKTFTFVEFRDKFDNQQRNIEKERMLLVEVEAKKGGIKKKKVEKKEK